EILDTIGFVPVKSTSQHFWILVAQKAYVSQNLREYDYDSAEYNQSLDPLHLLGTSPAQTSACGRSFFDVPFLDSLPTPFVKYLLSLYILSRNAYDFS